MENKQLAEVQRTLLTLTVMVDGFRMRQQLLETCVFVMLQEAPADQAPRIGQRTADLFRTLRQAATEDRHPAAEASALQLLADLHRACARAT